MVDLQSDDPAPAPPARPMAADCCRGGCDPCVFEIYESELARYEEALRQWSLRHPASNPEGDSHATE